MKTGFDWQTDEMEAWPKPVAAPEPRRQRRRLHWLFLLLLLGAGIGFSFAIRGRVDQSVAERQAEVEAAFQVVVRADASHDPELLSSALSQADPDWAAAQLQLAATGLLFDRSAWGWAPAGPVTLAELTLDSDLQTARITAERLYDVHRPSGNAQTEVKLAFSLTMRNDNGAWRLASPTDGAGAIWVRDVRSRATIIYRRRDEVIGAQLATLMETVLAVLCFQEVCGPAGGADALTIRLSDDPSLLESSARHVVAFQERGGVLGIDMPSPVSYGRPDGSIGRYRLSQLYAIQAAQALMAWRWNYECCARGLLMQGYFDQLLAPLGLAVLPEPNLRSLRADLAPDLADMADWWGADAATIPGPDDGNVKWLIVFLAAERPELTPDAFAGDAQIAFRPFLSSLRANPDTDWADLEQRWQHFLSRAAYLLGRDAPPLPDQQLLLSCRGLDEYRLGRTWPALNTWETDLTLTDVSDVILRGFVDDNGFALQTRRGAGGLLTAAEYVSRPGQTLALAATETGGVVFAADTVPPPTGIMRALSFTQTNGVFHIQNGQTLLAECDDHSCPLSALPGYPLWSPDGSQILLIDELRFRNPFTPMPEIHRIWLQAADGLGDPLLLGVGRDPVWLGDGEFAFLTLAARDGFNVTIGTRTVDDVVFRTRSAFQISNGQVAQLDHIFVNPADTGIFYGLGAAADGMRLVRIDAAPRLLAVLPSALTPTRTAFSSDGRWLSILDSDRQTLYLVDLLGGGLWIIGNVTDVDWSADGQWLAYVVGSTVNVWAPAYPTSEPVSLAAANCQAALWINEPDPANWPTGVQETTK